MNKILIIDDKNDNLTSIKAVLLYNMPDCEVITSLSGKDGIELAIAEQPDTILLDVIMPVMDGFETCSVLKKGKTTSHIPVIMLTAIRTDSKSRIKGLEIGADAFLSKPIDAAELTAQINVMLRIKRAEDALRSDKSKLRKNLDTKIVKLSEVEQQYKALYDFAPIAYQSVDKDGMLISVNPEWLKILGYKKQEVVGKWFGDFIHADYLSEFEKIFSTLKKDGVVTNIHSKFKNKHGYYFDVSFNGSSIYDSKGKFIKFLCVFYDITKQKSAENIQTTHLNLINYSQFHSIEEFLREFLDNAEKLTGSEISFFHFVEDDQTTLSIQVWSTNTMNKLSFPNKDDRHYSIKKAGVWVDAIRQRKPVIHNDYASLKHKKGLPEGHIPIVRELVIPIMRADKILAIVGVGNKHTEYDENDVAIVQHLANACWDIVLHKQANNQLRESEERYRSVVTASPDAIIIHCEGKVVFVNKSTLDMFGAKHEDDLIGKQVIDFVHPSCRKLTISKINKMYKAGVPLPMVEVQILKLDGSTFYAEISVAFTTYKGKLASQILLHDITNRKKAQSSLLESEARFKKAILLAPNPIMIHNEDGEVLQLSRGWTKYSGYTIDDIPTIERWTERAYPEHSAESKKSIDKLINIKETINRGERHVVSKNGEIRIWEFFATPLGSFGDKKKVLLSVAFDITVRVRAQNELLKLTTAVEQSANVIVITDIDGNIEYTNPKFTEITGYTAEEALGQNPRILNAGTQPKEHYINMWKTITGGKSWKGQFHNKTKSNTLFWEQVIITPIRNKDDKVTNYLAIKEDITAKKEAEQALRESDEKYRDIANLLPQVVFETDVAGNIIFVNEHAYNFFGYTPEECAANFNVFQTIAPDDVERAKSNMKKLFQKIRVKDTEFIAIRKDGTKFPVSIFSNPIIKDGKPCGLMGIIVDMTDRVIEENKLKKALERAKESDRLKSAFLSNMSHEIRTPMNGILGFTALLKEHKLTGDVQEKYIQIIEKSGTRMLSTINDIIDISKVEAGQMEVSVSEVNINNQIEYLYVFFNPETDKKGIKLSYKNGLSNKESNIVTDREKFNSILTNLVKNAIKYTDNGSIEFGYKLKNNMLQFYVVDTGIGIAKARQKAVFNRFVQADIEDQRVYEGSGLGLAISKAYVKMLGGNIKVESTPGVGSSFYFTIPYSISKQDAENNNKSPANGSLQSKKLKILIAEDEEIADLFLTIVLNDICDVIFHAQNGKEAVMLAKANPDIDIILMDVKMPLLNGYQATQQIREFNKKVVIIAQTAYALEGDREKAIIAGCDDYISKPIDRNKLLEIIHNHVINRS